MGGPQRRIWRLSVRPTKGECGSRAVSGLDSGFPACASRQRDRTHRPRIGARVTLPGLPARRRG